MPPPSQPAAKSSLLANVIGKTVSVLVLLGLSLVVFAYRRSLTPLYGSAATDYHFNKIVWTACIIGSFAPNFSSSSATLAAGVLLCLMPNSAYWIAVYTGRMDNVVWGPVATHLIVIAPVIAIGVALVKALQQSPDQQENASPQQLITLPVVQTTVMTLQDLWPVVPYVKEIPESQIFLQSGILLLVTWIVSPLLSSPSPTPSAPPASEPVSEVSATSTATSSSKAKPQHKRKPSKSKIPAPEPTSAPSAPLQPERSPTTSKSSTQNLARLLLLPILPFFTSTFLQSPTLPKPLAQPYLHPTYPLRILSSVHSVYSGVVVVGEILPSLVDKPSLGAVHSVRYLRAGHSLLGGVWIGDMADLGRDASVPAGWDQAGEPLGDTVYHAFMLQEAVRLVERPGGGERENALVIGLGAGVSAATLIRSNISTTIVEIDPAVYDAAKRFFALPEPEPGKIVIKDVRAWLRGRSRARESLIDSSESDEAQESGEVAELKPEEELYDIVVHDVFTGGGLPGHVFTQQFWNDTKAIMNPDGVLAVNFAGQLDSESSRAIILTLKSVFGSCRAFCDELDVGEKAASEFHNWLLLCSPSSAPLTLRTPRQADYFGSDQRSQILSTLSRREFNFKSITDGIPEKQKEKYILTDAKNPLTKWQEKEALNHWKIMREVFPDVVWETY